MKKTSLTFLFLLIPPLAFAQADQAEKPDTKVSDSELNVRGVFESELPGVDKKHAFKMIVHPHIGDLERFDHLRTTLGLRYTFSSRLEFQGGSNLYFGHGLGDTGLFSEFGFADFQLGAKYHIGFWRDSDWDTAVGLNYQRPLGNPPPDITDGFVHYTPFATFARPVGGHEGLRVFWGFGADFIQHTNVVGSLEKNDFTDSSTNIKGGVVWERGAMNYTFEAGYATTRLLGGETQDVVYVRPGFVYSIPKRFTFNSRSNWVFGLAFKVSDGPDGTEVGISGKLRLSLNFKDKKNKKDGPVAEH